jgi:hypothetical protein
MKRALRWIGIGLGAIVVVAGVIFAVGSSRVNRTYEVQTVSLPLVTDSAGIARGGAPDADLRLYRLPYTELRRAGIR